MSPQQMKEADEFWNYIDGDTIVERSEYLKEFVSKHRSWPLMLACLEISKGLDIRPLPTENKPEEGKQYSLLELSKTGKWSESVVAEDIEETDALVSGNPKILLEFF